MPPDNHDLLDDARTRDGELLADQIPPHLFPQDYHPTPRNPTETPEQYWRWVLLPSIILIIFLALYWVANNPFSPLSFGNPTPTIPFYSDIQFLSTRRSAIVSPKTDFEENRCWVSFWPDVEEVPVFRVTDEEIIQTGVLTRRRVEVFRPLQIEGWYQLAEYYPTHQGQGVVLDRYFTGVCEAN